MTHSSSPTIAAIATAPGRGGVGIIRLSGPEALSIAEMITQQQLTPRYAHFARFLSKENELIDEGLALYFKSPHSFTGEDVVELQGHGGPVVMDRLLKVVLSAGAQMAKPGEFSERAFLNGKMDLTQVEAVADLINANSEQAARSAIRSLKGKFSEKINHLQKCLIQLRLQVEALIDFPDEDIEFAESEQIRLLLESTITSLHHVKGEAQRGALLQSGLQMVIAGKPNAGKSSLLNHLTGQASAIVTNVPGTTRDVLKESIQVDGLPLHVIDTAGIRETDDIVEQEGVRRAYQHIEEADFVLLIIDATSLEEISLERQIDSFLASLKTNQQEQKLPSLLVLVNKTDLLDIEPKINKVKDKTVVYASVKTDQGMALLKQAIKDLAGFSSAPEDQFIARARHVDAIDRAYQFLIQAQNQLQHSITSEFIAEDLRQAQMSLSEVTGEYTPDDLLGEIFSSFCIGK